MNARRMMTIGGAVLGAFVVALFLAQPVLGDRDGGRGGRGGSGGQGTGGERRGGGERMGGERFRAPETPRLESRRWGGRTDDGRAFGQMRRDGNDRWRFRGHGDDDDRWSFRGRRGHGGFSFHLYPWGYYSPFTYDRFYNYPVNRCDNVYARGYRDGLYGYPRRQFSGLCIASYDRGYLDGRFSYRSGYF